MNTYLDHAQIGWLREPRPGARINTWAEKVRDLAYKLDAMEVPDDVAAVLRELFEEIGQRDRDAVYRGAMDRELMSQLK